MNFKILYIVIFVFLNNNNFQAQESTFGFTAGLSFSFGNKVNRIGLRTNIFYGYQFIQLNAQVNLLYNFQTLALKNKTPEIQVGIGAQFGWSKSDSVLNPFIGLINKNIPYNYSFGYTYLHYWDKQKTSQGSGIWNVNIKNLTFATQNDLFGWGQGWRDRFRTGALILQYRYLDTKIGVKSEFWTGDYTGCTKVYHDKNYPARFGYYLNDKGMFTHKSAGLLSLQIDQIIPNVPYQQIARVNLGVDSEKVRYAIQNKFMHDMPFYTDKMVKRHLLHYPMLDKKGNQYLFQDDQSVKPTTFYFNLGMNEIMFY
jgi:hypothetical protein